MYRVSFLISCVTEEQEGSWTLVLTLISGAFMGAGFLLTYGLTWLYCTRTNSDSDSPLGDLSLDLNIIYKVINFRFTTDDPLNPWKPPYIHLQGWLNISVPDTRTWTCSALPDADMVPLLLLPLLWGGSLQQQPGYEIQVQGSVIVQEGLCIQVPCSVSYPRGLAHSSSTLYTFWYRRRWNSSYHDGLVATNDPNKSVKRQTQALTETPDIHIPEPLEAGHTAQLTCQLPGSCEGGRSPTYSWVGAATDSWKPRTPYSSVLNLLLAPRHHGTALTSVKTFRNASTLSILEGEAVRLLCEADSNPPAELSWFRGSPALNATPISSTATLELPRVGTAEEGEFSCGAQHPLGSQTLSLSLSVLYPPQLLGPSCSWEDQGLHCSCSSRAQPGPSLRWRLGAGLLEGNHSNASYTVISGSAGPWANSSLSLSRELSAGLRLSCEASNVHGAQSAAVLLLPGKSVSQVGVVPAALGGAGVMALLSLCLCLLFLYIVRALRKPAAGKPKVRDGEDPIVGTVTWEKHGPDRFPDEMLLPGAAHPSAEQQELPYANLSFPRMKLQEPQDQEAASSAVYSEIKKTSK
ncbi:sialic acid-binding Ig-like lectin 5 [Rhynchonycteris naso]